MLEIKSAKAESVTIISPAGRIDSATAKTFEEAVLSLLDAGSNKVVVDLSALQYVSSIGLRVFLAAAKKANSLGGALTTCAAQPGVREVFEISGIASAFGMHAGVDEACAALKG